MLVLADPERGTCVEDGACVLCNMMNAAHSLGLASCWIHGEREMFQLPEGKALLRQWGLRRRCAAWAPSPWATPAGPLPQPKPRKEGYIHKV